MAKKFKLTRPELKKQRDALKRFQRYLPMLKLKQQQLQASVLKADQNYRQAVGRVAEAKARAENHAGLLRDLAGVNVQALSEPDEVVTHRVNVAGVNMPVLDDVRFVQPSYSLFATPPWVDRVIADYRSISRLKAEADILGEQLRLLRKELTRIVQRVNLFDKLMIPTAKEAIRVIRIKLGDEQTSAVGRAKIAKGKLSEAESSCEEPDCEASEDQEVTA